MSGEGNSSGFSPTAMIEGLVTKNLEKVALESRAYLLFAAIVAIAALALVAFVDDRLGDLLILVAFFGLELRIVQVLHLTSRASTMAPDKAGDVEIATALARTSGRWWQLVVNDQAPGLSVIDIDLSIIPTRHRLSGVKFTPDGREAARWKSRAVGLMSIDPVEVFYYWEGSYADTTGGVSGVGFFEFPSGTDSKAETGTGWFTTGDVDHGDFSMSSKVHLRRLREDDGAVVESGGRERGGLVKRIYEEWIDELKVA